MNELLDLFLTFAKVGLTAFGGGQVALPELQREIVAVHGWQSDEQFLQSVALGRIAPGPNMLMVVFVGYHVAGIWGGVVSALGMFGPSGLLTAVATRALAAASASPWAAAMKNSLPPMTLGLIASSAILLGAAGVTDLRTVCCALAAGGIVLARQNPIFAVAAAALIGAFWP